MLREDAVPLSPSVVFWFFFEGNDLYNDQGFENAMMAPPSDALERALWNLGWPEMNLPPKR